MNITEKIKKYLDNNFDGRLMLEVNGVFSHYNNNDEILSCLVSLFEKWAKENENPDYNDPIKLWEYCLDNHNFGSICTLYYEDSSGDFCKESPYWF